MAPVGRQVELGNANQLELIRPAGGVVGTSFAAGAFAELGAGSVAAVSIQLPAVVSFRQPVTPTMSTFFDGGEACRRTRREQERSACEATS